MRNRFNYYTSNKTPYDFAIYRVAQIKRFYIHLFVFSIVVAIYILKTYFAILYFEPFRFINLTVIGIWGFIIGSKALKLFSSEIFFGNNWEQIKMDELPGKEQKNKWD